ncbi:MAG: NAD(+) synthase, partial [Solirubrobacteraceae bacterium]
CVIDHTGRTLARAAQFEEELLLCDIDLEAASSARLRDATQRPAARRAHCAARVLAPLGESAANGPQETSRDTSANGPQETSRDTSANGPQEADREAHANRPQEADREAHANRPQEAGRQASAQVLAEPRPQAVVELGTLRAPIASAEQEVYAALRLGLHDYVAKNGFAHVLLGLSGGIDSALVACVAADALGEQAVTAVVMPSMHSSQDTQADARALARNLRIGCEELPIAPVMEAYEGALASFLAGRPPGLTEENLQARIRGNLLMALSNERGWLVLTTGNKSEMSVGYTTLYGDLAGGFAVIKDVGKTLVYRLCEWRNSPEGVIYGSVRQPIPTSIVERAPSAELRPDQRDEDSLPPYPVLDRILQGYIELDRSREQLIAEGLPEEHVDLAIRLVDLAEYKRRQAPPGIKVTTRAFGRDRRMPITNRHRG